MDRDWPTGSRGVRRSARGVIALGVIVPGMVFLMTGCKPDAGPTASAGPGDVKEASATAAPDRGPVSTLEPGQAEGVVPAASVVPGAEPGAADKPAAAAPADAPQDHAPHREKLFENWPRPTFALFITGQQGGYIEPCGCTGLANQKGGLARRHSLQRELAAQNWPLVAVDVGNQIRRFGRQGEVKFQVASEALKQMGYQAVALGVDDLRISVGELAAVTLASDGGTTPFVSANAAVLDRALTPTHHIIERGGKRIGITAVLGSDLQSKIISSEVVLTSPQEGLDAVLPQLRDAKCDLLVLLAHASIEESQQLARKYPDFHVVVTAGGTSSEPHWLPEMVPGTKTVLVEVGLKGMFVGVLGFFDDPQTPWRYQRVPLDSRYADSPDMLKLLATYQQQLESLGLEGLGLSPLPHPTGREFVGSEKCGECHTKAFAVWQESRHAHATESLVRPPERSEIARHFDPECLSCHVTGWDPQKMFPYLTGYLSLDKTPLMKETGCENCHGPGSAHVAAQEGDAAADVKLRANLAMRLRLSDARKKCEECHDIDNSPDFHATGAFEKYWKKVEHPGID